MPTYEYRCKACGDQLEVVQSFTDDALTDCPTCGAEGQLRKVFGNIGITFKGSGFYKTDSRSGSSSSASTSSEKTETKSDTKTETTSESSTKSDSSTSSTSAA
jgi:putative FmdB family regulatory protein